MPGIPQIWYLDIFAGANDYAGVEKAGKDGHKEINRTTLSLENIQEGLKKEVVLKQLDMLRLRNTSKAFSGTLEFGVTAENELNLIWRNKEEFAQLNANLTTHEFSIQYTDSGEVKTL
jgi:sucrose phosphorylase